MPSKSRLEQYILYYIIILYYITLCYMQEEQIDFTLLSDDCNLHRNLNTKSPMTARWDGIVESMLSNLDKQKPF